MIVLSIDDSMCLHRRTGYRSNFNITAWIYYINLWITDLQMQQHECTKWTDYPIITFVRYSAAIKAATRSSQT